MDSQKNIKEERIKKIALSYYSRTDIRKAMFQFSQNRECVPRYFDNFGKRPNAFQYDSDIFELAREGWTSFHCSEELWQDPLEISTEFSEEEYNNLRLGWDLLMDIDSKYLDYSKILSELLIKALEFHKVRNISVKFSGKKGFHILIPWRAFPEEIYNQKTKNMFPEWPRLICEYLSDLIHQKLIEKITELTEKRTYVKDYEAPKQVMPDIILVSPRHLFRMPYSLHEGTALASVVIDKDKISEFQIQDANPLKAKLKNFYPEPEPDEAKELLLQALDWKKQKQETGQKKQTAKDKNFQEITIKNLTPNLYPPCITSLLKGIKQDGRKRALFILLNFFKSLNLSQEETEKRIEEWNRKNYKPLKQGYINSQITWLKRQKTMLPPNCDKEHYKTLNICQPDNLCRTIKNPVNYPIKKMFLLKKKNA